ncbi:MAG TPA: 30S ribosomal protein S2, partial [bacterium]|nr:30S ribosomal protein S2 [bacterium]
MAKYKVPKIQEMIDAGVHFGHQTKRWHPKMEPYIYTVSKGVHIIDLEKTEEMLRKACDFLYEQASMGKVIVFVGTKKQSKDIIEKEAKRSGALYVNERWVGGTITNFETIKKNIDKLLSYLKSREEGKFSIYTKKERLLIDREIEKLQASYGGISSLRKTPEVLFVIDTKREKTAIREAKRSGVPVVAIVDTNANPEDIDYPIPGNDDAIKSVALIVRAIADAVEEGYKEFG